QLAGHLQRRADARGFGSGTWAGQSRGFLGLYRGRGPLRRAGRHLDRLCGRCSGRFDGFFTCEHGYVSFGRSVSVSKKLIGRHGIRPSICASLATLMVLWKTRPSRIAPAAMVTLRAKTLPLRRPQSNTSLATMSPSTYPPLPSSSRPALILPVTWPKI